MTSLAFDILTIFAEASRARGHRRNPRRHKWHLWREEHEQSFRRGEAPRPEPGRCQVCGEPCGDWRAKTCSPGCARVRETEWKRRAA